MSHLAGVRNWRLKNQEPIRVFEAQCYCLGRESMTSWPAAWCAWAPKHRQFRGEGAVSLMVCLLGSPSGHPWGEGPGPSGFFRTYPAPRLPPRPGPLHFCSISCPRLRCSRSPHLPAQGPRTTVPSLVNKRPYHLPLGLL